MGARRPRGAGDEPRWPVGGRGPRTRTGAGGPCALLGPARARQLVGRGRALGLTLASCCRRGHGGRGLAAGERRGQLAAVGGGSPVGGAAAPVAASGWRGLAAGEPPGQLAAVRLGSGPRSPVGGCARRPRGGGDEPRWPVGGAALGRRAHGGDASPDATSWWLRAGGRPRQLAADSGGPGARQLAWSPGGSGGGRRGRARRGLPGACARRCGAASLQGPRL